MRAPGIIVVLLLLAPACGPRGIKKESVASEDRVKAVILAGQGDRLLKEGKDHLALVKYTEASVLYPYHEVLFNKLAVAYSRLQRYGPARKAVDRSIGLNSQYPKAHNTKGMIQLAQLDNKGAIRSFRKAIDLELRVLDTDLPSDPDESGPRVWMGNYYLNLGYAYMLQDKYPESAEAYRNAIRFAPGILDSERTIKLKYSSPQFRNAEMHYRFSKLFASLGDKRQALRYLDRALSSGFKNPERILDEKEFEALRKDRDFVRLLERYGLNTVPS